MNTNTGSQRKAMPLTWLLPGSALLLSGCAAIPDVTVSYRPVEWGLQVAVVHTFTCTVDGTKEFIQRGATLTPAYYASTDKKYQLRLKELDRFYADTDIAIAFTDDGRLKSINHASAGQGDSVVSAAVGAVAAMSANFRGWARTSSAQGAGFQAKALVPSAATPLCKKVREWTLAAADEPPQVSVVQGAWIAGATTAETSMTAEASADQRGLVQALKEVGQNMETHVAVKLQHQRLQPAGFGSPTAGQDEVMLSVQQIDLLDVAVKMGGDTIATGSVAVPIEETVSLPIPKAALFGKQSFTLTLADSGRITSIGYGRTTGVPAALGATATLAGAKTTKAAAEAASLTAAADLIAAQQRSIKCRLKPEDC